MVTTIDINGFPHTYELSESPDASTHAPVLVFVHGWLLSRAYWQPTIDRLSPQFPCLAYDLRGFGQSLLGSSLPEQSLPAAVAELTPVGSAVGGTPAYGIYPEAAALNPAFSPAAYAQDLNVLLKKLNISQAWVIGHSLGGTIALWAADQNPGAIAGVICVNSGGGIYIKEDFEKFRAAGQQIVKFRPAWLAYVPFLDLALTRLSVAKPLSFAWGRQRLRDMLNAQSDAALGALLDSTTEAEVHLLPQVISRLSQPVHFIAGAQDIVMEPQYVRHLASFHPSFECCGNNVTQIEDCGHLAMLEQPDAVADEIRRVISESH